MLGQRCDITLSAFTIHSLNWPHGSSPRGTRPLWRPFNSHHTLFTLCECSIIPCICCTESVCATKGVYSMPNNFSLACIFFITCAATVQTCLANCGLCMWLWLTCSSEICFHLQRRLSNLSCLKGAGIAGGIRVNAVSLWPCGGLQNPAETFPGLSSWTQFYIYTVYVVYSSSTLGA